MAILAAFLADLENDAERERLLQIMLDGVRVRNDGQMHLASNRAGNYEFTTRFHVSRPAAGKWASDANLPR